MGHLPSQALGEEPVLAGAATSPVDAAGTGAPLIGGAPASGPGAGASLGMPWNNTHIPHIFNSRVYTPLLW